MIPRHTVLPHKAWEEKTISVTFKDFKDYKQNQIALNFFYIFWGEGNGIFECPRE